MFRSYETGRDGYVTILANYQPFQEGGGPNFYMFDPDANYEIHIDQNGDGVEDLTFRFRFSNDSKNFTIPVGSPGHVKNMAIPLIVKGPVGPDKNDTANLNVIESYELSMIVGHNQPSDIGTFLKPVDRIGDKTIPQYAAYAQDHVYDFVIPGCSSSGRVFAGQRREGFVINVDELFDLVNTNPLGPRDGEMDALAGKNISTLALELPIACIATPQQPIIGAWTTASLHEKTGGSDDTLTQVSRLGMPLVNELVIGLKDKDKFNGSQPADDAQFLDYVTNPTVPELLQTLYPTVTAPNQFPRTDLVSVFLTGIPNLNQPPNVHPSEMLRLNTSTPIKAPQNQSSLGVIGGDTAGYPNGRRPGDDVVDISLRVLMGKLLPTSVAPSGQLPFTDGALINALIAYDPVTRKVVTGSENRLFFDSFPYLRRGLSPSPAPIHQ